MTKTTKKKCNGKCKNLCITCEHVIEETGTLDIKYYKCDKSMKLITNCVDGEKKEVYKYCEEINENGNCPKWKLDEDKDLKNRLINILNEYKQRFFNGCSDDYYPSITKHLLDQLKDSLINSQYLDYFISNNHLCYRYDKNGSYTDCYKKWKRIHK